MCLRVCTHSKSNDCRKGIRDLGRCLMDISVEWQSQGCGWGTVLYYTGIRHLFMCHGAVGISKKLDAKFPIWFVPAWQHPLHELSNHHQITGHTSSACMLQYFGAAVIRIRSQPRVPSGFLPGLPCPLHCPEPGEDPPERSPPALPVFFVQPATITKPTTRKQDH